MKRGETKPRWPDGIPWRYGIWVNALRGYLLPSEGSGMRRLPSKPQPAWWLTYAEAENALRILGFVESTDASVPDSAYVAFIPPERF